MKIAVIGAGAMGSIYGGHLSLQNEVWLVDTNQETVEHIQKNGLILQEEGQDITYHPSAVTSSPYGSGDFVCQSPVFPVSSFGQSGAYRPGYLSDDSSERLRS